MLFKILGPPNPSELLSSRTVMKMVDHIIAPTSKSRDKKNADNRKLTTAVKQAKGFALELPTRISKSPGI